MRITGREECRAEKRLGKVVMRLKGQRGMHGPRVGTPWMLMGLELEIGATTYCEFNSIQTTIKLFVVNP